MGASARPHSSKNLGLVATIRRNRLAYRSLRNELQQVEAQHGYGRVAGTPAPTTPVWFVQGLCQRFAGLGEVVQFDPEEAVTAPGGLSVKPVYNTIAPRHWGVPFPCGCRGRRSYELRRLHFDWHNCT